MENAAARDERQIIERIIWRIMPLVVLMYLAAIIDRANVGFAKLQMVGDLKMSEAAFGHGSSLFFVGYLLFEIPSTLAVHKFGARIWFARIMMSWGVATVLLAFAFDGVNFAILRILLGIAEAGLYPGAIYYLTLWFPQQYQTRVVGFLTLGSAFGNMFGSLMGGPLLDLNGLFGLAGWQWVFLVTGLPPIVLTGIVLWFLPNRPADATFLSACSSPSSTS